MSYEKLMERVENGNLEMPAERFSLNPEDILVVDEREICYGEFEKIYE